MGRVAPIAPPLSLQGQPKPVQPAPRTDACAQAKCAYCGRYGGLGQCQGCGAPNQPTQAAVSLGSEGLALRRGILTVNEARQYFGLLALVFLLLSCASLSAQVGTEPLAWAPEHRALADGISNALIGIQAAGTVYQDVKTWRDGDHKPTYRSGCSIGLALAITETLKRAFPEIRPDGSDEKSGFSGHSAATAALSGWRFEFGVPIASMAGLLRASANKHHLWGPGQSKDIPLGWAIGAGAQALCSAVIR